MCDVEKNGYIDLEIKKKDKNKVLHVFRTTSKLNENSQPVVTLRFMIKYQKSCDLALDFQLKDIKGIID